MRHRTALSLLALLFVFSGVATAKDAPQFRKISSLVTTGGDDLRFKRIAESQIKLESRIFFVTTIAWEPLGSKAGRHKVMWRWYANGTPISEIKQTHTFYPTPFEFYTHIPATVLGIGHHKVELFIDGKSFDSQEFEVIQ